MPRGTPIRRRITSTGRPARRGRPARARRPRRRGGDQSASRTPTPAISAARRSISAEPARRAAANRPRAIARPLSVARGRSPVSVRRRPTRSALSSDVGGRRWAGHGPRKGRVGTRGTRPGQAIGGQRAAASLPLGDRGRGPPATLAVNTTTPRRARTRHADEPVHATASSAAKPSAP